ncbi:MAG: TolC family protein [Thermoanaerobaculia bacterium]
MKRFPRCRAVASTALALVFGPLTAVAQDYPAVSARPGQRTARPLPAAAEGGVRLSLSEAIGLALANNQDLNVSVNEAEASRFLLFAELGIFDPLASAAVTRSHQKIPSASQLAGADVEERDTLDLSANVAQLVPTGGTFSLGFRTSRFETNSTFFSVNPSYSSGLTFSANQPLLRDFGWDATTWLIYTARNTRDIRYQEFIRDVQTVVHAVEQAYWDLVYALRNLEVQRESRALAADLNRITRIRIDVGSLAPIDIVQTEVGIATAEQEIIIAEDLIGDAQDRLKRLLNFDPAQWEVPIVPIDEVRGEQTTVRAEEGTAIALRQRPDLRAAAFSSDSLRIRYDFYKNQALPNLDLVASYGLSGLAGVERDETGQVVVREGFGQSFENVLDADADNWSVGLNFSIPIFNRGARGRRGEAQYTWEASKASLNAMEQNVLVEVRDAARAIETAGRSIAAAQKARELAERNLDAERKRFENGMTTSFQVTEIQRDLSLARTNELQALAIYRKAVSAYHYAIADILEWKGIRIDAMPEPGVPEVRMWQNQP